MKKCKIPFRFLSFTMLFLLIISCENSKNKTDKSLELKNTNTSIKYANGFDIQVFNGYKKLIIKSPYPDADQYQEFILISDRSKDFERQKQHIYPCKKSSSYFNYAYTHDRDSE